MSINYDLWERLLILISSHEKVTFNWVKGHAGHLENERCDELAFSALNGDDLLIDEGYQPNKSQTENDQVSHVSESVHNIKVKEEGDLCRKCGTKVIKKQTKKKNVKPGQTYYFEYYLLCPSCKTMYLVEEAKREIGNSQEDLFS